MQIAHLNESDPLQSAPVLILCTESSDLAAILKPYAPNAANSISCEPDESYSIAADGYRFEIIGVKKPSFLSVQKAVQSYVAKNRKRLLKHPLQLLLQHVADGAHVEAAVNGAALGTYDPALYKTENNDTETSNEINVYASADHADQISRARDAAETQKSIFELVNAPSNKKTPHTLSDWAITSGTNFNYEVTVFEKGRLEKEGFEGLLAVNRGSEEPARFIICDYNPEGATKTLALVGKGVTFDTGGVSLKPGNNMHLMKSDMGGAAAVLGAVELIAKRKLPLRVVGFVPTTDNSIGTEAIKPGDVIGSYSGKTIEVINTDAEGRLILADGLNYAVKHYDPDVLIDLATLTGSVIRALGMYCAGLFTNNDELANQLIEAGNTAGERVWRMPMWDEYGDEMRSEIADYKNLSDSPAAGSITAAKFLEFFTEGHKTWAHMDIAGTAFGRNGGSKNHTATAFGVRLIMQFASSLSQA